MSYNPRKAGVEMQARRVAEQHRLRVARGTLWQTLAGDGVKINNSPAENETEVEWRDPSEIVRLNESKAALCATLNNGCIKEMVEPSEANETAAWVSEKTGRVIVSDVPAGTVQRLNEAKAELLDTLTKQNIVKIKQKNNIPLTDSQNDFVVRHMAAASRFYNVDISEELDEQLIKYDEQYREALRNLHNTLRGK